MGLPTFGADSGLDRATILATPVAASGFPASNAADDRAWSTVKSSATTSPFDIVGDLGSGNTETVNYFGMIGHNLGTLSTAGNQVTITFAHSSDNISYTTIFSSVIGIGDNSVVFRSFTSSTPTRRFFRLRVTRATPPFASAPEIGELQWGTKVEVPFGMPFPFDPLAERLQMRSTRSQTGNILGTVDNFVERSASINLPFMPVLFVTGSAVGCFQEFWDNHASQGKPFFWNWNAGDPGSFEKDTLFAVVQNDARLRRPIVTPLDSGFRDIQFDIVGLKE